MLREEDEYDPGKSMLVRGVKFLFPVTDKLHGEAFFVRDLDPWLADLGGHRGADSQP